MNRLRSMVILAALALLTTTAVAAPQRAPQTVDFSLYLPLISKTPDPQILSFQVEPNMADPGQTVTISWEVAYADQITLTRFWDYRPAQWWENLPLVGEHSHTVPNWERNPIYFNLHAYSSATGTWATAGVIVNIICPDVWFFEPSPGSCPSAPLISPAAEQPFEHGFMIWLDAEERILVLFADSQSPRMGWYDDNWDGGAICNMGPPPAGQFHPERGFGYLWCQHETLRQRLGWGIAPEVGYETILQRTTWVKYNNTYLRAADGNVWRLWAESSGWEKIIVTD